jgi:hypothetical protein
MATEKQHYRCWPGHGVPRPALPQSAHPSPVSDVNEKQAVAAVITRALEHLRLMSIRAFLESPEQRKELFEIADLVHNAPSWLVDDACVSPLDELRRAVSGAHAAVWLARELDELGVDQPD